MLRCISIVIFLVKFLRIVLLILIGKIGLDKFLFSCCSFFYLKLNIVYKYIMDVYNFFNFIILDCIFDIYE